MLFLNLVMPRTFKYPVLKLRVLKNKFSFYSRPVSVRGQFLFEVVFYSLFFQQSCGLYFRASFIVA